jgi:3-hydroxyacyl-CoA dehydrogenase
MLSTGRLRLDTDLSSAVKDAHIVQEQVPENTALKQKLWFEIEKYASPTCLFWSSTSGIPSSTQSLHMSCGARLLVAHPINPPHVMPLIEIAPSAAADPAIVTRTVEFWKGLGKVPVVLKKEVTGFVANRLAYALFREAIYLVDEGVVDVEDIDRVMVNSMGMRWARAGPFKSYDAGGGDGGIERLMRNVGEMIQACWDDQGKVNMGEQWEEKIYRQTRAAYRK